MLFWEYCFGGRELTEFCSKPQTRWVLQKTRWVRFGGKNNRLRGTHWVSLLELGEAQKLTELDVWNHTLWNRIRPVSDDWTRSSYVFDSWGGFHGSLGGKGNHIGLDRTWDHALYGAMPPKREPVTLQWLTLLGGVSQAKLPFRGHRATKRGGAAWDCIASCATPLRDKGPTRRSAKAIWSLLF